MQHDSPGFEVARVWIYQGSKLPGFALTGVRSCWGLDSLGFKVAGVWIHWGLSKVARVGIYQGLKLLGLGFTQV